MSNISEDATHDPKIITMYIAINNLYILSSCKFIESCESLLSFLKIKTMFCSIKFAVIHLASRHWVNY